MNTSMSHPVEAMRIAYADRSEYLGDPILSKFQWSNSRRAMPQKKGVRENPRWADRARPSSSPLRQRTPWKRH